MTEQQNLETIRDAYAMWSKSEAGGEAVEHWIGLCADDVSWRSLADGAEGMAFSRARKGKGDVQRYFEELAGEWEMIDFTCDEFIADGDRVVMLGSCGWRYKGSGSVVETPKADFIRMRDGKITEFLEFYDTAKALDAARAPKTHS